MLYIFLVFQQETVKGPKEAHHLPLWKPWQGKHGTDSCHDPEMQKLLLTYFQEAKVLWNQSCQYLSVPLCPGACT